MKIYLKHLQNYINDMMALAKSRWYPDLGCRIHYTNIHPQIAWECIDILKFVDNSHSKKTNNKAMNKKYGKISNNDKDNMRFMYLCFQNVFNNHQPTDFSVLKIIKQQQNCGILMTL